ncbi:MAG TPA: CRISPR-associated RAMP protein Csx10 [Herpetosiphonaceae bacterium]
MTHRITIVAQGPLSFAAQKPGAQYTPSLDYVPGGVLWGALGHLLRREPDVRFSHALPAHPDDAWVRLLPVTATRCKVSPGFRADGSDERPAHGIFDTLIDRVCAEQLRPAALIYEPLCPTCSRHTKIASGSYTQTADGSYRARGAQRRILTRVAIDRRRGTAAEGLLYAPIVLSETNRLQGRELRLRFVGQAWNVDAAARVAITEIAAIGGRISSGLGQVTIAAADDDQPDDLHDRLRRFNAAFQERWRVFERLTPQAAPDWTPDDWRVFSVSLQSDAILLEQGWQPTITFSAEQLFEQTQLDAALVYSLASAQVVGGWNVSWDRPKPTALAAQAGGVYVFRTRAGDAAIVAALERLEREGIGQRTREGYGAVRCCDPWHVDARGEGL